MVNVFKSSHCSSKARNPNNPFEKKFLQTIKSFFQFYRSPSKRYFTPSVIEGVIFCLCFCCWRCLRDLSQINGSSSMWGPTAAAADAHWVSFFQRLLFFSPPTPHLLKHPLHILSGCGGAGGAVISVMRVRFLAFLDYFPSFVFLVAAEAMVKGLVVALLWHLRD